MDQQETLRQNFLLKKALEFAEEAMFVGVLHNSCSK